MKKLMAAVAIGCAISLTGCAAVLIGAGAGGTVLWQAGKIITEETQTPGVLAQATKAAFEAQEIALVSEVSKDAAIQLRGQNTDLKKVAVDLIRINDQLTRMEIRVGVGERDLSRELLAEIKKYY